MIDNGIPTSKHITITDINQFDNKSLKYPIIVKPADSNSSKGVRRIDENEVHANEYIKKALSISRNGAAIIEEYKFGKEVGVDCIIKNHQANIIMTRERRKIETNNDAIQQIYGSFWPAEITDVQIEQLRQIAEKISFAFELDNTPLMMQTIVSDNEINVIEFGARIGGGENYHIIKELTGYDFIEQAIHSFLGEEISLDYHTPNYLLADNYIYMKAGVFGKIVFNENVKDDILYSNVYRQCGSEIGADISSNNRVGVFVVKAKTKEALLQKTSQIINNMEVYDIKGNPVMRKDIYKNQ
jgi:biotin carboxylase